MLRPRLWRTQSGHQEIAESCPELQREFPEPPLRGFGVVGKIAAGDEVLRLLRLDPSKGIEEASVRGMLAEPSREMWDHDGLCARGKRTYLFSRCPSCIEQEALDTAVEIAETLRPCELGANERVHQEVQKVLGAVVRQVGSTVGDTWSDWLVVAEYVIDNTPGPHGYTPRDLERSWSLALPLERDVLRAALEFEPVSEWARGQFKQFAELSAAVKAHWEQELSCEG